MKGIFVNICVALVLSSCASTSAELITRETAKQIVRPIVAERFPKLPTDTLVNCAIDNASLDEIVQLSELVATGQQTQISEISLYLISKPETIRCTVAESYPGIDLGTLL